MRFLAVKNYDRFQHYRDRRPVWIKLYAELLDDWEFLQLSDAARGQLMLFWLLASRHDNRVPNDRRYIEGKLATRGRFQLKELIGSGFIVETDEPAVKPASNALAEPEQDRSEPLGLTGGDARSLEAEGETEAASTTATLTAADDAGHADRFTEPRHRDAYAGIRRAAQNPKGLDHELQLLADGGERPGSGTQSPYGWATVGEALHQLSVNGGRLTSRALQSFCAKVASAADDEAARERRTAQTGAKLTMMGRGAAGRADDGADVLAELRNRIERIEVPGHGINRVLRRERVEELGADVAAAVERIGGVRVITECAPDRYSFLVRDFSEALARARREAAA